MLIHLAVQSMSLSMAIIGKGRSRWLEPFAAQVLWPSCDLP